MSDTDVWGMLNSWKISDLQQQQQVQMRLTEFKERADTLGQQTGEEPLGFFAFEKNSPTPHQTSRSAKWLLGIVAGLVAFTTFGAGALVALGVAAAGFAVGAFLPEMETTRMNRALGRYDNYLTQTEISASQSPSRAPVQEQDGPAVRKSFADTELARRDQQQGSGAALG